MYCSNHMSSVLHLYASVCAAALFANIANRLFSKPFERFTPSHRYPGLMLNLFGGGSGPLYTGFSVKSKKRSKKICKKKHWVLLTKIIVQKCKNKKILDATWFKSGEPQIKPFTLWHHIHIPHCSFIFYSTLFSIHFLWCLKGQFACQSRASSVGDHFLYSSGFNICFRGEIVQRN